MGMGRIFVLTAAAIFSMCGWAKGGLELKVVDRLTAEGANRFYVGNRQPLLPSPLIKLPVGRVKPKGWLETQLRLMADGLLGRLPEISPWCKWEGNAWSNPRGEGHSHWEELPYWLRGFTSLAYILGDKKLIAEAQKWVDAILPSQEESGYFGPRENWRNRDLWSHMLALDVLRTHYEATGDKRVIPFMLKFCKWLKTVPLEDFLPPTRGGGWQHVRGGDLLDSVIWLYNHTGQEWLIELARIVHDCTAPWKREVASWHGVNICQGFREPAQFWQISRDIRYLQGTVRNYETVMGIYGQVPGGMFGADENCRPGYTGPQQAAETCSMAEFIKSHAMLARITGDGIWADRAEEIAFNSLPAAFTPDYKALHYLTAPNMVQLDRGNKAPFLQNAGTMLSYEPFETYRCCQHNHGLGWTSFVEHLWMATPNNGLAAVLYAPCEVSAKVGDGTQVRVFVETDYPFDETVQITVRTKKPVSFPLVLRIPFWCVGATVKVNSRQLKGRLEPNSFAIVEREWRDNDKVTLNLPMRLQVKVWEKQRNAVSVRYGPLWFSLKIGERWEKYREQGDWACWEVFPTTPWNYGLIVEFEREGEAIAEPQIRLNGSFAFPTSRSFEVVKKPKPLPSQPFTLDNAPIELLAKGKRIPQWTMVGGIVGPLQDSPVHSDEPVEEVRLIPMGCARLRISVFPRIASKDEQGHVWKEVAGEIAEASHTWHSDTVEALHDGLLPQNSCDHSIPRWTAWDRKGTTEWVQYTFVKPRKVSWCEVYWFDDEPVGGGCRVPRSWRLLWWDGEKWQEVRNPSGYGVAKDQFNKVTFEPVVTTKLRLEIQAQPNFSVGILEWRYGE
ncbi:MAG: glycoside hydrolase family 127 protein [Armatimonadota bacterium]|nr:glycoside hydrolase family 127 protein [Armatimonadota bacterium]MDW8144001.1 glycoside hydrolase family 127 protein [Armatimonadota bacterium]